MSFSWQRVPLTLPSGETVTASAPVILSASRSTDIPAFHARWFMRRLEEGWMSWTNPFNRRVHHLSLEKVRAVVFWTKDPRPLLPHLEEIERRGLAWYIQYTLNDYEREGLEPRVPPLAERLRVFRELAERWGAERVIWRFDPLLLTPGLTVEELVDRAGRIGDALVPHTRKLVFSYADVARYRKVQAKLIRETPYFDRDNVLRAELTPPQRLEAAQGLVAHAERWRAEVPGFEVATCAEELDLSGLGIAHNRCIDDELLLRLAPGDGELARFLGVDPQPGLFGSPRRRSLKDTGQRAACGCVFSKDIGAYDTCGHLCAYCYANSSARAVERNLQRLDPGRPGILPGGPS